MVRPLAVVVLAVSSAVLFSGCPPTYPKCASDEGCKEHNEVCIEGQCVECAADANCKAGFSCQANKCVPRAPQASAAPVSADTSCSNDEGCAPNQLCIRSKCVDITADLAECGMLRVHFGFNSTDLEPSELPALAREARCLKAQHSLHVTIEGNADERGTEDYNLHLSQRRGAAVEKYLENLGAPAGQLKTIGYGYENPICKEHDEECWAKNRRAGIKPQGKQEKKTK